MSVVTLNAHYDGKHICLDDPFEFKPDTKVKVMVWVAPNSDASAEEERQAWLAASQTAFARAYGNEEPDYSDAVILERPTPE